jgi:transcription termination factor NusB
MTDISKEDLDQEIAKAIDSFKMENISILRNYTVMRSRIVEDVKRRITPGRLTIHEALVEIEWVFIEGEGD